MGIKERRERERADTRDKILEAARELFIQEGYDGVSMRKVAEKIEYSATAIYVHFANKKELFRELCYKDFTRLAEVFQSAALPEDPRERLKNLGRIYVEFGKQYPNHYKLMFMTPHPAWEPDERDHQMHCNPEVDAYALLKHTVQQALDAGVFREGIDNVALISQTLWAGVHGVISLRIAKENDCWVDCQPLASAVDLMLDALVRGLTKEG
jgi:AcrR family transcriptional regulator